MKLKKKKIIRIININRMIIKHKLLNKMILYGNYKIKLESIYQWTQEETQNRLKIFIIVLKKNLKQKKGFVSIFIIINLL